MQAFEVAFVGTFPKQIVQFMKLDFVVSKLVMNDLPKSVPNTIVHSVRYSVKLTD